MNLSGNNKTLTLRVKAEAISLGFQLVGVTSPQPSDQVTTYSNWLANGRHAGMEYLASDRAVYRRQSPLNILPECKSILSLGLPYSPQHISTNSSDQIRIAAYALGDDYHDVFDTKLTQLVNFIEKQIGSPFPHRMYSDTGPVLEREIAQRAGLGWIGKNTCLINPKLGSFFLLGEILLGVTLDPDEPFSVDHCGICRKCIDSCPTEAILSDRTIDSNLCISYLTIENRGEIPSELRGSIGEWLFGCDICQNVCPWNIRFARHSDLVEFQPREFLKNPSNAGILKLIEESYRSNLQGSPLKRAKLSGLIRNASITAANTEDFDVVPILAELLTHHPDAQVRSHCAWAIGQLQGSGYEKILRDALDSEDDPKTRDEIYSALD
jgi:epoxyqueuosine reductase